MKLTGIGPENRPSLSFGGRVLGKNTHYQVNGMEAPFSTAGSGHMDECDMPGNLHN